MVALTFDDITADASYGCGACWQLWAAPYGVLKRALHTVWKNYRQCIAKLQAVGKGPVRGGNLLRSRRDEEEDDMMSFSVRAPSVAAPRHPALRWERPRSVALCNFGRRVGRVGGR
jgi:hypothetical protein